MKLSSYVGAKGVRHFFAQGAPPQGGGTDGGKLTSLLTPSVCLCPRAGWFGRTQNFDARPGAEGAVYVTTSIPSGY